MKIPHSIRILYADQLPLNERLKGKVDELLRVLATRGRWHYESRIKSETSFALKLESGRIKKPLAPEDFFACTLVVQNLSVIDETEREIRKLFRVTERRPYDAQQTHKLAENFPFDDLRLYGYWLDDPALPESGLSQIKFEMQIKTFLQHAWGIATHDLIYKTDNVSWSRQRIAYQVKAMLEHAEISIQEADRLAQAGALAKTQRDTEKLKDIIQLLTETWGAESLPPDLRRLGENARNVMTLAKIEIADLRESIEAERVRQKGSLPTNISPYATIVQAVAWHNGDTLRNGLANRHRRERLFLVEEMDLPKWLTESEVVIKIQASPDE